MPPVPGLRERLELFKETKLVRDYFGNVPPAVMHAVFPFHHRQWHLLAMAARCPGSVDLIMSNPALAYCLASCWTFTQSPSRDATRLMRRVIGSRRRDICGALGFPTAESSVSVLAKIPTSMCFIPWLLIIRALLKDSRWRKTLWHLPSLENEAWNFLLYEPTRRRATPRFLHELSESPVSVMGDMIDVIIIEEDFGQPGNERFHSLQQFHRHHRQLLEQTERYRELSARPSRQSESTVRDLEFPKPPIPGSEAIIALENQDLLSDEGRIQHNCVGSYDGSVARGLRYYYRILEPERATLSIVPDENGRWQIDQLLRAHNEPVSDKTHQAVAQWLSGAD